MSVRKRDIVNSVAEGLDLPQLQVAPIVQEMLDVIIEALATEGRVEIRGFGSLEVRRRKRGLRHNPRTGTKVFLPDDFTVRFRPGNVLASRIGFRSRNCNDRPLPGCNGAPVGINPPTTLPTSTTNPDLEDTRAR